MRFVGLLPWLDSQDCKHPRSIHVWRRPDRLFQLSLSRRTSTIVRLPPADLSLCSQKLVTPTEPQLSQGLKRRGYTMTKRQTWVSSERAISGVAVLWLRAECQIGEVSGGDRSFPA